MSLTVALQMDPVSTINVATDSTYVLGLEAQRRGHRLWHYLPRDLALCDGRLTARARPLTLARAAPPAHATLGEPERLDLAALDVILMRQDPPFDVAYITATHLLEHAARPAAGGRGALIVNDPVAVRNAPEKLLVTHWPHLAPPTLITSDRAEIDAFRAEQGDIVVKPLYGNGGFGVFHLPPGDENLGALLETFGQLFREPVITQRYLPEVRQGDKRILLVEGLPVGAVLRVPQTGEARANFHAGGRAQRTDLTDRERQICAEIGPYLRDHGLLFVGIDVIGDHLTEINVTSPTGIQEIDRLTGSDIPALTWDAIEARRAG